MSMSDFYKLFPKLAEAELRTATFGRGSSTGLPGGRYGFVEAYCDGMGCDCRRVMIGVYSEQERDYVAHINLGFDSDDEMVGPFLDPLAPQGPHAEELLAFFTDMINRDPAYLARLQRHYVQFKERLEGQRYAGRTFETPGRVTRVALTAPPRADLEGCSGDAVPDAPARREAKIGRNDPCPCGSGKKCKRCCQGKPQAGSAAAVADSGPALATHLSDQATGARPDDPALTRRAEALIATVVRWRQRPGHEARWGAEVQATLEAKHALAFPLLRLLLTRYAPDGRQQTPPPDYAVCLGLLEEVLTQIRYSVERNRPSAVALAEQLQREIAAQGFRPEVDVRLQQDLIMALHGAKLDLHPSIREKAVEVAGYYARFSAGKGAPDLDGLFNRLVQEIKPINAFDLLEPFLAEMAVLPTDGQVVLVAGMLASSQPVLHDLAVLMLLHPEPRVRTRLPELYRAPACLGNLSPVGLRRLIGLRNWLPVDECPGIDALIKAARLVGVTAAPLPSTEPVAVHASAFDGSGTQAAWIAVKDRRRYRIESLLVRQGDGVREAFSQPDLTKRELEGTNQQMRGRAGAIPVDADYLRRMIGHFIAVGQSRGAPPPPQLLSTNEWAGGGYWTPEPVSPADEIERLGPAFRASVIAEREQGVLAASKHWPASEGFAASWSEDDARIEALLREHIGGPERWLACLPQAASALVSGLLESKREVWIERLLWMALLSAACRHDRPPMPWPAFVVIAKALQRGTPMAEVPLMQAVAERSVQSAWQRSFRNLLQGDRPRPRRRTGSRERFRAESRGESVSSDTPDLSIRESEDGHFRTQEFRRSKSEVARTADARPT